MHFRLIHSSSVFGDGWPANDGYGHEWVVSTLGELEDQGHTYVLVDTDYTSDEVRHALYMKAATTRNRVRDLYGSRSQVGLNFGREIPALLVAQREDLSPDSVYPRKASDGSVETIAAYLKSFL